MAEREENIKQKEIPIQELKEQLEQIQSGITSMEHEGIAVFDSFSIEADESQYQRSFMSFFAQRLMTTAVSTSR